MSIRVYAALVLVALASSAACSVRVASGTDVDAGSNGGGCPADPVAKEQVLHSASDPENGKFTMDQALAGLPEGPGPLRAIIETTHGTLTCELRPDVAPIGVANFVGLARGRRPFLDPATHEWTLRRFYDGLTWHRVIPNFVAQGGDPLGTGYGGPGYTFGVEPGLTHVDGAIAYANSGLPNTNGSQFYVCDGPQHGLDGMYTVFGVCTPSSVVKALTHVKTDANDKPLTPEYMTKITITRCAE
jgi:peptidyl-prolyl cis-trans isomerase A (cyclophilin A)